MENTKEVVDGYSALKLKRYRLYLIMKFSNTLAIKIMSLAVAWQVYKITKDPLALGLIGLAEVIPAVTVALYAGYVADVRSRKSIIIVCIALLILCSTILWTAAGFENIIPKNIMLWLLYGAVFLSGLARGFLSPAVFGYMADLVPNNLIKNAITWNSSAWEIGSVLGLALGGLLYDGFGPTFTYGVQTFLLIISITTVLFTRKIVAAHTIPEGNVVKRIKEGLNFVWNNELILSAITLDLFAVLFGGAIALLPVFADQVLQTGSTGLGFLRAAPSIGALLMAFYLARNPLSENSGKILIISVGLFGCTMIGFALSPWYWLSWIMLFASGIFDEVSVYLRSALVQILTPQNMKGRVSSVNSVFINSSNELGAFESGLAAKIMGLVPSVVFGGGMTILTVGFVKWKWEKLWNLDISTLESD
jgi:MFS family permease